MAFALLRTHAWWRARLAAPLALRIARTAASRSRCAYAYQHLAWRQGVNGAWASRGGGMARQRKRSAIMAAWRNQPKESASAVMAWHHGGRKAAA